MASGTASKSGRRTKRTKPTKPGFYWFRGRPESPWEVVRVEFISQLVVCDTYEGSTALRALDDWPGGEWVPAVPPATSPVRGA